jgi:hypothetical protein
VGVLGEDLRVEAGRAQVQLQRQRVVADRVAVGERGEELVDGGRFSTSSW